MPFEIIIDPPALEELRSIRAFDRRRIIQAIEEQLTHEPDVITRNRKPLTEVEADFTHDLPLWQLRVGDFRVFYNIEDVVLVRAVRAKPPHQTTEQVV